MPEQEQTQDKEKYDALQADNIVAPQTVADIPKPTDFKTDCKSMSAHIELLESKVKHSMNHHELVAPMFNEDLLNTRAETITNLKLSYRHLEDARMRLGKAIQAHDRGKSCYPA
jgi:hypothetical protein